MKREDMIERIVEDVDGWDFDTLIDYAKDQLTENMRSMGDDDLQDYYNAQFGENLDDDEDWIDWVCGEEPAVCPEVVKCSCGRETDKGEKCWWCGAQN